MAITYKRQVEAQQGAGTTSVTSTTFVDLAALDPVDLTAHFGAHVTVDADRTVGTTSHCLVQVLSKTAAGDADWDDIPFLGPFILDMSVSDPRQRSFIVEGVAFFKVQIALDSGTDTIVATGRYRRWDVVDDSA